MKKFFISAMVLLAGLSVHAQLVEINSMSRVALPEGMIVSVPTISPDGSFVVVSDARNSALTKIDLENGATSQVAANASGYDVKISADGRNVVYREFSTGKNNLRYTALKSADLTTGKTEVLVKPTRKLNAGMEMAGSTVTAVENGRTRTVALNGSKATAPKVAASINYGHLDITVNGKTTTIDPQGRGSYLWPSVSPDGTKVVYYLAGRGCYVCDIDGSNSVALGMLRAAKWLNNEMIVGMNDTDNGEYVTSSSLIASDLKGKRQTLTDSSLLAMYPSVDAQGNRIAFATADGQLFIINLK